MNDKMRSWLLNIFKTDDLGNLMADIRQTVPVREIQGIQVRCITEAPNWNECLRRMG